MKRLVRIICLIIIAALLPTLTACDRRYDEAEVKAAAKELIVASAFLNDIYYGNGMKYLENSSRNNGVYCEADPAYLLEYGFKTLSELRTMTKKVFTEAHSERMFKGSFSGTFSQTGGSSMARYYQKVDKLGNPEYIMVYSEYESLIKGVANYDLESIKVLGAEGDRVYITVDVCITYEDKQQNTSVKIALLEEENGWRFDSPSYVSYNEYLDIYEELQKG